MEPSAELKYTSFHSSYPRGSPSSGRLCTDECISVTDQIGWNAGSRKNTQRCMNRGTLKRRTASLSGPEADPVMWLWECRRICVSVTAITGIKWEHVDRIPNPRGRTQQGLFKRILMSVLFMRITFMAFLFIIREKMQQERPGQRCATELA